MANRTTTNQISRVEVAWDQDGNLLDCAFFFVGSQEPHSSRGFLRDSHTRNHLEAIEDTISDLHKEAPQLRVVSGTEEEE